MANSEATIARSRAIPIQKAKQKQGFLYELKTNKVLFLMLTPAVLLFLAFSYVPMFGAIIAFKNYNYADGIFNSPWAGLDNFNFFFISGTAATILRNTVLYNLAFMAINITLEVGIAIVMAEVTSKLFKKITQTMLFLPHFISWVVVGAFVYNIFNFEYGTLNGLLRPLGMEFDAYSIQNSNVWIGVIIFFNAWKSAGFGSIIYLSSIMGIDGECYEAATIDGANIFQKIKYITLPMLSPTIIMLTLMAFGRIFRGNFDLFYQIIGSNSMLFDKTDVIETFVTRSMLESNDFGMTSAAGFFQSILCLITITVANSFVRKIDRDVALY